MLLRESYRDGTKIRTKTLANLSHFAPERIEALRLAFKGDFDNVSPTLNPTVGKTFGTYFALKALIDETGITKALGNNELAKLVSFLAMTRIAHCGSRLSAVRFAEQHAIQDILGIEQLDENMLYEALDYAAENQDKIEAKLYQEYLKKHQEPPALVLYDVTSSYFEGQNNELAAYGYNRDGKKGKKQIVIGLLADIGGEPIAIRVFEGNTSDSTTVTDQINKLKSDFSITEVIFVGDRGMVKTKGQEALNAENYNYITALTDAQVRKLLDEKTIQLSLFDQKLSEVEVEGKRYVLILNDQIKAQKLANLDRKLNKLKDLIEERNQKVTGSVRAKAEVGLNNINAWVKTNRLDKFITLELKERTIEYRVDTEQQKKFMSLYGCYVLVTDVGSDKMTKEEIKRSYKSLQKVELDFKMLKTGFLEVRPIFVRKSSRTIGHVFIAMLALKVMRLLNNKLEVIDCSAGDALNALSRFIFLTYEVNGKVFTRLPNADELQLGVFKAIGISLPKSGAT